MTTTGATNPPTTRILGGFMVLMSSVGLYFNISVFFHFLSILPKTSFYLMCISKTVSNSLILLIYLLYNGPCGILNTILGSEELNGYLNHAVTYGIYLIGPLSQTLITLNRFLVVWMSPTSIPRYSNPVTVSILLIFWTIGFCILFVVGPSDGSHRSRLLLNPVQWSHPYEGGWEWVNVLNLYFVISLGVISNFFNLLLVAKLLIDGAMKSKTLSSESSRRRRKSTIRLFIQSLIQDWLFVAETINSVFFSATGQYGIFLTSLGVNLTVYVADGFVMYMFHRPKKEVQRRMVTVSKLIQKRKLEPPIH